MKNVDYFKILCEEIHSVVIASRDEIGLPSTRVIDIMLYDEEGIYFITAKGKTFYRQLESHSYISLSGITSGSDSMQRKSISIAGFVKNIGDEKLDEVFEKNSYMNEIYKSIESRKALEVFHVFKGRGEFFDLSSKPIIRANFAFGGEVVQERGFYISDDCKTCGHCKENCPQDCIEVSKPYKINQENCLHCGNCYDICPNNAIKKL